MPHPPPATAPVTSTSLTSMFQQQHSSVPQSQQGHSLPIAQSSISHHSLPTSISQPIASSQTNIHTVTPSSLHQFPQQQTSTQQQQPAQSHITQHQAPHLQPQSQHLPQQLQQNQPVPSLNQHGLIHLDQTQQTQAQPTAHSTYFRGSEASATTPYFHAPTPPVAQTQDSSYGSFGQVASQASHQQPSHSNTFGNNDYTYNDRVRPLKVPRLFKANLFLSSMSHTPHSSRASLLAIPWGMMILRLFLVKLLPPHFRRRLHKVLNLILLKRLINSRNLRVVKVLSKRIRPLSLIIFLTPTRRISITARLTVPDMFLSLSSNTPLSFSLDHLDQDPLVTLPPNSLVMLVFNLRHLITGVYINKQDTTITRHINIHNTNINTVIVLV